MEKDFLDPYVALALTGRKIKKGDRIANLNDNINRRVVQ